MSMNINKLLSVMYKQVVAVISVNDFAQIKSIGDYLTENKISVCEITFRTDYAKASIVYLKNNYPNLTVGAGTVLSVETAKEAISCGADFLVAPGLNEEVVNYCLNCGIVIIPGIETASEIEKAMSLGLNFVKFFPAEAIGGVAKIKALSAPYRNIKFMPTGGITPQNVHTYLALDNVICCGGSYLQPKN